MITGLVLSTSGYMRFEEIDQETFLEQTQKIVGGYIEVLTLNQMVAIVNEDGKQLNLEKNIFATELLQDFGWQPLPSDYIAGNIIFFGPPDEEGNFTCVKKVDRLRDTLLRLALKRLISYTLVDEVLQATLEAVQSATKRLAFDKSGNGLAVSTVMTTDLGLETAILDDERAYPVERYKTEEEALEGHQRWLEKAKAGLETVYVLGNDCGVENEFRVLKPRTSNQN